MDNQEYDRRAQIDWMTNEIRRNKDFINALDESGHYFLLASENSDKDFYLDDYVSDDEFNAIIAQIKAYLNGNIEHWSNRLRELNDEERNNLQGRTERRGNNPN